MRGGIGCGGIIIAIVVFGAILTLWDNDKAAKDADSAFDGAIPKRFQGAYNSISCQRVSQHMDGLVTIGGKDISYPLGSFTITEVISESDAKITFRGHPGTTEGQEPERSFTLTHAEVGEVANIDGDEYHRCSQY